MNSWTELCVCVCVCVCMCVCVCLCLCLCVCKIVYDRERFREKQISPHQTRGSGKYNWLPHQCSPCLALPALYPNLSWSRLTLQTNNAEVLFFVRVSVIIGFLSFFPPVDLILFSFKFLLAFWCIFSNSNASFSGVSVRIAVFRFRFPFEMFLCPALGWGV